MRLPRPGMGTGRLIHSPLQVSGARAVGGAANLPLRADRRAWSSKSYAKRKGEDTTIIRDTFFLIGALRERTALPG